MRLGSHREAAAGGQARLLEPSRGATKADLTASGRGLSVGSASLPAGTSGQASSSPAQRGCCPCHVACPVPTVQQVVSYGGGGPKECDSSVGVLTPAWNMSYKGVCMVSPVQRSV